DPMSDQPLPHGWVQEMDLTYNHPYYVSGGSLRYQIFHTNGQTRQVDTNVRPPRSIWVHPYEDAQYLREQQEMLSERLTVRNLAADRSQMVCVKLNFIL